MSFLENLTWRYATKKFNGEIVSQENLDKIVSAIQYAPSANGTQPYHIVVASGELKNKLIENSGQKDKLGASHIFVFCSRTDYPERLEKQVKIVSEAEGVNIDSLEAYKVSVARTTSKPIEILKPWADCQAYIALGFAIASCAELKIDACPMEGFKPDEFKKILDLPDFMNPVVIMTIGYRDTNDSTSPEKRKKFRFPKSDLFEFRQY